MLPKFKTKKNRSKDSRSSMELYDFGRSEQHSQISNAKIAVLRGKDSSQMNEKLYTQN